MVCSFLSHHTCIIEKWTIDCTWALIFYFMDWVLTQKYFTNVVVTLAKTCSKRQNYPSCAISHKTPLLGKNNRPLINNIETISKAWPTFCDLNVILIYFVSYIILNFYRRKLLLTVKFSLQRIFQVWFCDPYIDLQWWIWSPKIN